ncbi:hypothetical protein [Amycolatopsis sp. H20-H5]|uniref:hypothetical protein n=1 Tax=Amycolatopsis sp. H20-H5 TaxID=3046309 RepID=UPI002DBA4ADC|nr:hypothetical protein [Amycolatopsis sp. H20-H5]MEC3974874.1 hypothetical protein [Amycolatopsis sp. H20-H5]
MPFIANLSGANLPITGRDGCGERLLRPLTRVVRGMMRSVESEEGGAAADPVGESVVVPGEPWLVTRQRELRGSPGYRGLALVDRVKRTAYVFQANVAQYQAFVAQLQDPGFSLPIMEVKNPGAHDGMLSEAERLLHNVLTALSTRVDHQRRFMEKHFAADIEFTKAYKDNVAATFNGDMQAVFLKGLRNYMAHRDLPVGQSSSTMSATVYEIKLVLPCEPLLRWERWNSDAKSWIERCGAEIDIADVVADYARKVEIFDQWLADQISHKYAVEIQEYRQAHEEYTREHHRVFGL